MKSTNKSQYDAQKEFMDNIKESLLNNIAQEIRDRQFDVEDANVLGECVYVMSNKAKAALRGMIKGENGTGMVYESNSVDGTPAFNTSNVEDTNYIYGDWSNLAIGQWGAIDLTVDPYTQAANGIFGSVF